MSAKLAAAAATRTSTWPSPGSGSGTSARVRTSSGSPSRGTVHARTGRPYVSGFGVITGEDPSRGAVPRERRRGAPALRARDAPETERRGLAAGLDEPALAGFAARDHGLDRVGDVGGG